MVYFDEIIVTVLFKYTVVELLDCVFAMVGSGAVSWKMKNL